MRTLINDDCMKVAAPKCRFMLTDIPYGEVSKPSNGLRILDKGKADAETFNIQEFLDHTYAAYDICTIFCGYGQFSEIAKYFADKPGTMRPYVWAKSNPSPLNGQYVLLSGVEVAIWFKKRGTGELSKKCQKNWSAHPTGSSKIHPTEKNHKLLEELITINTKEGDLVFDPCMGSGSTGVVAEKLGREFYGVELDPHYYNVAKERLEKESKNF